MKAALFSTEPPAPCRGIPRALDPTPPHSEIALRWGGTAAVGQAPLFDERIELGGPAGSDFSWAADLPASPALGHPPIGPLPPPAPDPTAQDERPPQVLALYLVGDEGTPAVRVEREGFSDDPHSVGTMVDVVSKFVRDALSPQGGIPRETIVRAASGTRGICAFTNGSFGLVSVIEGRETEAFLEDLRRLARDLESEVEEALRRQDGDRNAMRAIESRLRRFLDGGKYGPPVPVPSSRGSAPMERLPAAAYAMAGGWALSPSGAYAGSSGAGSLGLGGADGGEPPPRLLALYMIGPTGMAAARAERDGFTDDTDSVGMMAGAVADFVRDGLRPQAAAPEGGVVRAASGDYGLCAVPSDGFRLVAAISGRETDAFLENLRGLAAHLESEVGETLRGWDGNRSAMNGANATLGRFLESGEYGDVERRAVHFPHEESRLDLAWATDLSVSAVAADASLCMANVSGDLALPGGHAPRVALSPPANPGDIEWPSNPAHAILDSPTWSWTAETLPWVDSAAFKGGTAHDWRGRTSRGETASQSLARGSVAQAAHFAGDAGPPSGWGAFMTAQTQVAGRPRQAPRALGQHAGPGAPIVYGGWANKPPTAGGVARLAHGQKRREPPPGRSAAQGRPVYSRRGAGRPPPRRRARRGMRTRPVGRIPVGRGAARVSRATALDSLPGRPRTSTATWSGPGSLSVR